MARLVLGVLCVALLGLSVCEGGRYGSYRRGRGKPASKSELKELQETVTALQQNVSQLLDTPLAAFTAFYAVSDSEVGGGEVLRFPNQVDYGDVYNDDTGIFTAPVDGIYSVGVSIRPRSVEAEAASVFLVKQNADASFSFPLGFVTVPNATVPNASASTTSVIYLDAGCKVLVNNTATATFSAGTSFTGFLIRPVTLENPNDGFTIM